MKYSWLSLQRPARYRGSPVKLEVISISFKNLDTAVIGCSVRLCLLRVKI